MDDEIDFDEAGIFILPGENKEEWQKRARGIWQERSAPPKLLESLYHVKPNWVEVSYSKKELYPWEIALTLFDGTRPWIEVTPKLQGQENYLRIYSKEEILVHEYVHVVRAFLDSDEYEEIFAYYPSTVFKKGWRLYLGSLFSSHHEVLGLIALVTIAMVLPLFTEAYWFFGLCIVGLYCGGFLVRGLCRLKRWFRCKERIGLPLMLRLTDAEITHIAQMKKEDVRQFFEKEAQENFRMQFLARKYCH